MSNLLNDFQESIRQEIVDALSETPHNGNIVGERIDKIVCVHCDQPEAWTYIADPFTVHCNRKNNCGISSHVKNYTPEFFDEIWRKHPPTEQSPLATATAYLQGRSIDTDKISGQYGQGRVGGFHTVSITPKWSKLPWHRLVGKNGRGKNKWAVGAKYGGQAYTTDEDFSKVDEVWIVEGAINLWSLEQVGFRGAATLASGNIPDQFYKNIDRGKKIVLAFDSDTAGEGAALKNKAKLVELGFGNIEIVLPPDGSDWNDLLAEKALTPERLDQTVADAKFRGLLFGAESPEEHIRILYDWKGKDAGQFSRIFSFRHNLYEGVKTDNEFKVEHLADARVRATHRVISENGDHSFVVTVETPDKEIPIDVPAEIMTNIKFHELVLRKTGRLIPSEKQALRKLFRYLRSGARSEIRDTDSFGLDEKSGWFLFKHAAYGLNGNPIRPEDSGEYRYRGGRFLRGLPFKDAILEIDETPLRPSEFVDLVDKSFGGKGLLALGFWIASVYSAPIFNYYHKFPFISLYGEAGTGKSTFTRILNRAINFIDTEGFGINKSTSTKAIERTLSQLSSMCMSLAEWTDQTKFTEDHTLNLYGRLPLYSIAARTQDKTVLNFPFRCSIAFVMNTEPFSKAETKERVLSVRFRQSDNSPDSLAAMKRLQAIPRAKLATIGDQLLKNRQQWEALDTKGQSVIVGRIKALTEWMLTEGMSNERVIENHCTPLAAFQMFLEIHCKDMPDSKRANLMEKAREYALSTAIEKADNAVTELAEVDTMLSIAFDERNNNEAGWVKWVEDSRRLHIWLEGYVETHSKQIQSKTILKAEIKRSRNYVGSKQARVKIGSKQCCIFEFPKDPVPAPQKASDIEPEMVAEETTPEAVVSHARYSPPAPMPPTDDISAAIEVYKDTEYTYEGGDYLTVERFRQHCIKKYPKIFTSDKKFDELASSQKFCDKFLVDFETDVVSMREE